MVGLRLTMPQVCSWCFSLRDTTSGLWVGEAKRAAAEVPDGLRCRTGLVLSSDALNLWAYYASFWVPGAITHPHFHIRISANEPARLLSYESASGSGGIDEQTGSCLASEEGLSLFHTAVIASRDADQVPRRSFLGACHLAAGAASNCSYLQPVQSSPQITPQSHGIAAREQHLAFGPASTAAEFEWVCVPCNAYPISGGAAAVLTGLGLLVALPAVFVWRVHRRSSHSQEQWPAARRSIHAWMLLLTGWLLIVLGLTPGLLWAIGRWWPGSASYYLVLCIVGASMMMMSLRADDHPMVIRFVLLAIDLVVLLGLLVCEVNAREAYSRMTRPDDAAILWPDTVNQPDRAPTARASGMASEQVHDDASSGLPFTRSMQSISRLDS